MSRSTAGISINGRPGWESSRTFRPVNNSYRTFAGSSNDWPRRVSHRKPFATTWTTSGASAARSFAICIRLRKLPVERLLRQSVHELGGPAIHNASDEQQRSFDSTCRKLRRFLDPEPQIPQTSPFLRQPVKTQFSLNGKESHEFVSKIIHQGIQDAAVRRLELGGSIVEVARACEVNANVLDRWRRELVDDRTRAFCRQWETTRSEENHVAELERKVGRQALEIDFLRRLVYPYIEKEVKMATPIPVQRLCVLGQVSRAGFYGWQQAQLIHPAKRCGLVR
jgi:transposase-like protein